MTTTIKALNAIYSKGLRVMVEKKDCVSTMFYLDNGVIYAVSGAWKSKREDLDLEGLYILLEFLIGEGWSIRILGKKIIS